MTIVGLVALWVFAIVGLLFTLGVVASCLTAQTTPKVEAPEPKAVPQIVNLRPVPQPAEAGDLKQPAVLQKTTMQITTTKYVDLGRKELEPGK